MDTPPPDRSPSADPRRGSSDPRRARDRGLLLSRRLTRGLLAVSAAMVLGFSALAAGVGRGPASTPATSGHVASSNDDTSTTDDSPTNGTNDDSTAIATDDSGTAPGSSSTPSQSSQAPAQSTQSPSVTSGAS